MNTRDELFQCYKKIHENPRGSGKFRSRELQIELFTESDLRSEFPFSNDELVQASIFINHLHSDKDDLGYRIKQAYLKTIKDHFPPASHVVTLKEFANFIRQILLLHTFQKKCWKKS